VTNRFATKRLSSTRDVIAPDGSEVRVLLGLTGGGMAHFSLPPGAIARAIRHRTVEEIWFVIAGSGAMWRNQDGQEEIVRLEPGVSLTIPLGTRFQFRADADTRLEAVGVTMPPWPGDDEAILVDGPWNAT
jgi:mannose-6-phosphate isomerase-like protein (cupin superfamily)